MFLRRTVSLFAVFTSLAAAACGSNADDPAGPPGGPDDVPPDEVVDPSKPAIEPNAIALQGCPGLETDFAGDEQCLRVPAPEVGMQLHIGPKDYDDPDELGQLGPDGKPLWLMLPGDERTANYRLYSPNEEPIYYFHQHYRMRNGSHHMIISRGDDATKDRPEGWGGGSSILNAIGGTQRITEDWPPGGLVGDEDKGLGRRVEAHTPLDFQLHFYNTSDEPRLREAWVNLIFKPEDEVTTNLGMLGGFTGMNVPPYSKATVGNTCKAEHFIPANPEGPVRIVNIFGHAHTHNTRFAVWHDKADGESELIYDSYDGAEAPTYTYNTVHTNPTPDADARKSGASSGILELLPGEQLRYQCDINNTTEYTFRGANEVNTDEMCNLFGSVQGLGFPCFDITRIRR